MRVWRYEGVVLVPIMCTPRERPRNFDLVQTDATTYICFVGHSA